MLLIVFVIVFYLLKSSRKPVDSHPASVFGSRPVSIENGSLAVSLICFHLVFVSIGNECHFVRRL